ncbi:hypothetical protein F4780DRAFT_237892 [Xylariomycetidae sp. FL0641]|nr:hypothetical protein F4780DRAFT_237892 [Xylariomycetidae sp. FL0641]
MSQPGLLTATASSYHLHYRPVPLMMWTGVHVGPCRSVASGLVNVSSRFAHWCSLARSVYGPLRRILHAPRPFDCSPPYVRYARARTGSFSRSGCDCRLLHPSGSFPQLITETSINNNARSQITAYGTLILRSETSRHIGFVVAFCYTARPPSDGSTLGFILRRGYCSHAPACTGLAIQITFCPGFRSAVRQGQKRVVRPLAATGCIITYLSTRCRRKLGDSFRFRCDWASALPCVYTCQLTVVSPYPQSSLLSSGFTDSRLKHLDCRSGI